MSSYQNFTFDGALTKEQIDFFNLHGFIHFEHYTSDETVQAIIASTENVDEQWSANVRRTNSISTKYERTKPAKRSFAALRAPTGSKRLQAPSLLIPPFSR